MEEAWTWLSDTLASFQHTVDPLSTQLPPWWNGLTSAWLDLQSCSQKAFAELKLQRCPPGSCLELGFMPQDAAWKLLGDGCPASQTLWGRLWGIRGKSGKGEGGGDLEQMWTPPSVWWESSPPCIGDGSELPDRDWTWSHPQFPWLPAGPRANGLDLSGGRAVVSICEAENSRAGKTKSASPFTEAGPDFPKAMLRTWGLHFHPWLAGWRAEAESSL